MIVTDLDGTLLNDKAEVSLTDIETLQKLGEDKIIRVAATGRSLFLVEKVLNDTFPIDYLIFSSGAGIYDWKEKRLLNSFHLSAEQVEKLSELLKKLNNNLMIFNEIPENHNFNYWITKEVEPDFISRLNKFQLAATEINSDFKYSRASQIMTILPDNIELFNQLKESIHKQVENIKVIRASSPIDGKSIWLEVFPKGVSKGDAVKWLCKKQNISLSKTTSVGNDYNDLDMLNITQNSFVVSNSPKELLENKKFKIVSNNNENGFSEAVYHGIYPVI